MNAANRERFAAVVRAEEVDLALACLLIGAEEDPELDPVPWLAELDRLAELAGESMPASPSDPADLAAGLAVALGENAGFGGSVWDYSDLRSSLLHEVLRRKRGLPILLSVVWLEVARRLEVPAYGVGLPGRFVVGVGAADGDHVLVDPFRGGRRLTYQRLCELVAAHRAPDAADSPAVDPSALHPAEPVTILLRVLANIRLWAAEPQRIRTRLWAVELSLLLPHHPAELRRERGLLLHRIGEFAAAADDLEAYAHAVRPTDEELAAKLDIQARLTRARLN